MYNTRSDKAAYVFISYDRCTTLVGMSIMGEVVHLWGPEVYGKSLYLPLNLIKTKQNKQKRFASH